MPSRAQCRVAPAERGYETVRAADLDHIARLEDVLAGDTRAVHERAVGRPEVLDVQGLAVGDQRGVPARRLRVPEHDVGVLPVAADDGRARHRERRPCQRTLDYVQLVHGGEGTRRRRGLQRP